MSEGRAVTILLADDDEDDRVMIGDALRDAGPHNDFRTVNDGVDLLDYLKRRGRFSDPQDSPRPGLILLDLNMPRMDGREALQRIKADPDLRSIPVLVLTTSTADEDVARSYEQGANSYVAKPVTFLGLVEVMKVVTRYWLEIVELPSYAE